MGFNLPRRCFGETIKLHIPREHKGVNINNV